MMIDIGAQLKLSGAVNKQNLPHMGDRKAHKIVIGPFFFRECETVVGDRYRCLTMNVIIGRNIWMMKNTQMIEGKWQYMIKN